MRLFFAIATILGLPVLVKAIGMTAFALGCEPAQISWSWRLVTPAVCALLAYAVFVLEGAQSSVILANKQSIETLGQVLGHLEIPKSKRTRVQAAFDRIAGGASLYDYIIGRQMIIILCAFLFKVTYDSASLTHSEVGILRAFESTCPVQTGWLVTTHDILDHWLLSALICSAMVAYVLQVPAKLMAQRHPMLFAARVPGAVASVKISQRLGRHSALSVPLLRMRRRGEKRHRAGLPTMFGGREHSPVDTKQAFNVLADFCGENVPLLSIELSRTEHEGIPVWFVDLRAQYEVVAPSRVFGHAVSGQLLNDVTAAVAAVLSPNGNDCVQAETRIDHLTRTVHECGSEETCAHLRALFEKTIPIGARIVWEVRYFVPVRTERHGNSKFEANIFELSITKPTRRVKLHIDASVSSEIELRVLPIDGVQTLKCGPIVQNDANGRRRMVVDFPPINSRLHYRL